MRINKIRTNPIGLVNGTGKGTKKDFIDNTTCDGTMYAVTRDNFFHCMNSLYNYLTGKTLTTDIEKNVADFEKINPLKFHNPDTIRYVQQMLRVCNDVILRLQNPKYPLFVTDSAEVMDHYQVTRYKFLNYFHTRFWNSFMRIISSELNYTKAPSYRFYIPFKENSNKNVPFNETNNCILNNLIGSNFCFQTSVSSFTEHFLLRLLKYEDILDSVSSSKGDEVYYNYYNSIDNTYRFNIQLLNMSIEIITVLNKLSGTFCDFKTSTVGVMNFRNAIKIIKASQIDADTRFAYNFIIRLLNPLCGSLLASKFLNILYQLKESQPLVKINGFKEHIEDPHPSYQFVKFGKHIQTLTSLLDSKSIEYLTDYYKELNDSEYFDTFSCRNNDEAFKLFYTNHPTNNRNLDNTTDLKKSITNSCMRYSHFNQDYEFKNHPAEIYSTDDFMMFALEKVNHEETTHIDLTGLDVDEVQYILNNESNPKVFDARCIVRILDRDTPFIKDLMSSSEEEAVKATREEYEVYEIDEEFNYFCELVDSVINDDLSYMFYYPIYCASNKAFDEMQIVLTNYAKDNGFEFVEQITSGTSALTTFKSSILEENKLTDNYIKAHTTTRYSSILKRNKSKLTRDFNTPLRILNSSTTNIDTSSLNEEIELSESFWINSTYLDVRNNGNFLKIGEDKSLNLGKIYYRLFINTEPTESMPVIPYGRDSGMAKIVNYKTFPITYENDIEDLLNDFVSKFKYPMIVFSSMINNQKYNTETTIPILKTREDFKALSEMNDIFRTINIKSFLEYLCEGRLPHVEKFLNDVQFRTITKYDSNSFNNYFFLFTNSSTGRRSVSNSHTKTEIDLKDVTVYYISDNPNNEYYSKIYVETDSELDTFLKEILVVNTDKEPEYFFESLSKDIYGSKTTLCEYFGNTTYIDEMSYFIPRTILYKNYLVLKSNTPQAQTKQLQDQELELESD